MKSYTDLAQRVRCYVERAANNPDGIRLYPLNKVATWNIMSGSPESGGRLKIVVHGRYVDAIVYAIQKGDFYGWYCGDESPDSVKNCNNGYVALSKDKVIPLEPNTLLDKVLAATAELEKDKKKLAEKMKNLRKLEKKAGKR